MKENVNVDWSSIFAGMFTDQRFRPLSKWRGLARSRGRRSAWLLATRNPMYSDHALNKGDMEGCWLGKRDGKLDHAFVVDGERRSPNNLVYFGFRDAPTFTSRC